MLGDIIKNARKSKRIMQKELADMLNVRPSTVSMWEAGTRTPDVQTIIKIAEVLEIPFSRLMHDMSGIKKETAHTVTDESDSLDDMSRLLETPRTRSEWRDILSKLSRENKIKLMEYARLLLLSQGQDDQEDQ